MEKSLRRTILIKTLELITAAFSLVAALAWNDAIQSMFAILFGTASSIWAKFIYAILVTSLAVFIVYRVSKMDAALNQK